MSTSTSFINRAMNNLNECGVIGCTVHFMLGFVIVSIFLIIVNLYLYFYVIDHVSKVYPETKCLDQNKLK